MRNKAPAIAARPVIYIDLAMPDGRKQVLDIEVARAMHEQLGLALSSLDALPQEPLETPDKTVVPMNTPQPDDQGQATPDDALFVEGAESRPAV